MYEDQGKEKSLGLPVFHSFTGCDTTSAFYGRGKKSAWEVWNCFDDVTQAFTYMARHPYAELNVNTPHFHLLEHFTIILYDKTCDLQHVNEARQQLVCQKEKAMEKLFPMQDALLQHAKQAAYQAGIWGTSEQIERHTFLLQKAGDGLLKRLIMDSCVEHITNSCKSVQ